MTRLTLAEAFVEARPQLAQTLAPHIPAALVSASMAQIGAAAAEGSTPPPSAMERLRDLSRVAPLRPEPLLVQAALAEKAGDSERAEQLLVGARQRNPRSAGARYLLADLLLRQGRIVDGIGEMAVLARLVPKGSVELVPALAEYARTPGATQQLKDILADNPNLKRPLLTALAGDSDNVELILELDNSIPSTDQTGRPTWQRRLLGGLVREGHYERAYGLWQRFAGVQGPRPLVYNGEFRALEAPPPFNWTFNSTGAGFAEPGNGSMRVLYYGRENAALASQLLLLRPGTYRLSSAVSEEPAAQSLAWVVTCRPSGRGLTEAPLTAPTSVMTFEVPGTGCGAQSLELRGRAQDAPAQSDLHVGPVRIERTQG